MIWNFFGKKQKNTSNEEVLVFVPALVAILTQMEERKGSPLNQEEVEKIRDHFLPQAMRVSPKAAEKLAEERGYDDVDPEHCWEDWLALKESA
ncbi:hypothetical protein MHY87_03145 [Microvirga sp. ACRRW]|uniref:hypothetical protein n=1 Tax=Microvirga sp. ACRRW TaxID=2918205 RepID=UPI001EF43B9F|nr:hypothetical protein [Microvirga sp. ACRRW]MCG7391900.1 hypothetical protein [Microvirga sp. ACRRW]